MNQRYIEWIWHVKGNLALAPGKSSEDVFEKLDPLFRQSGTSHERTNDTLTFRKKDPAAQDKMSIFDGGVLRVEAAANSSTLHYDLTSRTLLACFLAPLMFLAFAQATIVIGKLQEPSTAAEKAAADAAKAKKKAAAEKMAKVPLHPIDQALGAPAPEKPKKDKDKKDDEKPSPTAAYVFAALFAILYLIGRILEHRLVSALFRKSLSEGYLAPPSRNPAPPAPAADRSTPTAVA